MAEFDRVFPLVVAEDVALRDNRDQLVLFGWRFAEEWGAWGQWQLRCRCEV